MNTVKTPKGTELPLLNLKGKSYLQVAHRVLWAREEHPDWRFLTEIAKEGPNWVLFKATILDSQGALLATAHKREDAAGFPDYYEKSETGALGRALALCGYGTQFTDELEEGNRLADSPLSTKNGPRPIVADQPTEMDGELNPPSYRIPFGKWAQRSIEEVFASHGDKAIADYITYLEDSARKKGTTISGKVEEFITKASSFLAAMEQQWAKEAGHNG